MTRPVSGATSADKPPLFHGRTGIVAALRNFAKRMTGQVPQDPRVVNLERQLLTCGFTQAPLRDLEKLARTAGNRDTRTSAAIELAKWYMRPHGMQDHRRALDWIAAAQGTVRTRPQRHHLFVLELLCLRHLGATDRAQKLFAHAVASGFRTPDLALAAANLHTDADSRIGMINTALASYGIPEIGLRDADGLSPYDRLICTGRVPDRIDGPKVSVILAAYEADDTLKTALHALQAQTWKNLEIIVVDDASPSGSTARIVRQFCQGDARIRLIEMAENGGAYMARNRALDTATGDYVTLHDADDWSHPRRIEIQVDFLRANPTVLGCASEQARATNDLEFLRWSGAGRCIMTNYSSLMFRRAEMRRHFGYWDTVRLSADNELIRRMRAKFGQKAVNFMRTGPLAFQRYAENTMTSDPVLGINGFLYGARQEYFEAHMLWHRDPERLCYTGAPDRRPFPAPGIMRPDRARIAAQHNAFDVIVATDFRVPGDAARDALDDIRAYRGMGLRVAAFALYRYLGASRRVQRPDMHGDMRRAIWDHGVRILCYGEVVRCRHLLIHDPACIAHPQRYLPDITPDSIGLIARSGGMAPGADASLSAASATLQASFGAPALWHPRDQEARQFLQAYNRTAEHAVTLATQDWEVSRLALPDAAPPEVAPQSSHQRRET